LKLDRLQLALTLALGLGAALRLALLIANPTLGGDDASLAMNVAARSYAGLLEPLDYIQVAPVLHLWLLRLAADLGGVSDVALRVVPFLAGVALPLAVWRLARRVLDPWPAVLATAFAALAPILIRYSVQIKPYEGDALVAALVAGFALGVLERPDARGAWWRLAAAGIVALFASLTAPFVLAGAGVAVALRARAAGRQAVIRTAALGVAWLAIFAAQYLTLHRDVATSAYMQDFWSAGFLTPRAFGPDGAAWRLLARLPLQTFERSRLPLVAHLPVWGLLVAGALHVARRRGAGAALLLTIPLAAALVASALRRYPVSQRLFLYAAPLVMVLLAGGVAAVRARWPTPLGTRVVGAFAGAWVATLAVLAVSRPFRREGMGELVAELRRRGPSGAPVYLLAGAIPMWAFYATDWRAPDPARLAFIARAAGLDGAAFVNAPSRGRPVEEGEGEELVLCPGAGTGAAGPAVLLGLAPGIQAREVTGFLQSHADPGWAEREAARIAAAARPEAWLVFANAYLTTKADLLAALRARGAVELEARIWRGAALHRYRLPGTAPRADARETRPCAGT
jgi:hypothetical protein